MAELKRCKKCGKISSWNSYFNGYVCECGKIERKETTNADRIRAMSDEELTKLLSAPCPLLRRDDDKGCPNPKPCRECIAEWLKQTAEEET